MESMIVKKSTQSLRRSAHIALWISALLLLAVLSNAFVCPPAVQKLTLLYPVIGLALGATV